MELHIDQNAAAVVGPGIDAMAAHALTSSLLTTPATRIAPFALDLISRVELLGLRRAKADLLRRVCSDMDVRHILPVGIGAQDNVLFLVVVWSAGQVVRRRLGLAPRQFYIQLSLHDVEGADRGISSLLVGQWPTQPSLELLDSVTYAVMLGGEANAYDFAVMTCAQFPDSEKGFLRLADIVVMRESWKLAMLAYGQALSLAPGEGKLASYCIKKMLACARHTEWGAVFLESELSQIPSDLAPLLLRPWPEPVRTMLTTVYQDAEPPTFCLDSTQRPFLPVASPSHSLEHEKAWSRLPRFFRWLVPFHFALMSTPRDADDIALFASPLLGIRHVLTLTEETPLNPAWFARSRIEHTFMPIPNYMPPTVEQMDIILRLFADERNLPILVHCDAGKGRAGTVAACYLAAFGFVPVASATRTTPAMESARAVAVLRAMRPGSIETPQQETFVQRWCSALWKRRSLLPEAVEEPAPCAMEVQGKFSVEQCDMLVLVGLPGAGKSWLAQCVVKRDPDQWTWVSQDEIGSRAKVEDAVGRARKRMILDRCNSGDEDRKWFLKLAASRASHPVCVWFDYPPELCTWRAQARPDHPTLPPGGRVRAAVRQMQETLVAPSLAEGFRGIVTIRSLAAADELVRRLCPPPGIVKFPRTPHLINLGAATDDDVVQHLSDSRGLAHAQVVITEKLDGANMGFSLAADRAMILVQNRSHYVNPASHEQFRKLGAWTARYREALLRVLDRDAMYAERYILYGEWMAATHSIPYARLPGLFVAFDLYDSAERTFAGRDVLEALLQDTDIELTPVVYRGTLPSDDELVRMASQPSQFYDGPREGIYVKAEKDGKVVQRGKVVRKDFIAGNEHWTKGIIRMNSVVNPLYGE